MLRHTFCHLPGIGPKIEQKLWATGVHSWADLSAQCPASGSGSRRPWAELVEEAQRHLDEQRPDYFTSRLPAAQLWRLFKDFRESCAYLDIETTGLGGQIRPGVDASRPELLLDLGANAGEVT